MVSKAIFPLAQWAEGTNQNSTPANDNTLRVQAEAQPAVAFAATAPGAPAQFAQYVLSAVWGGFAIGDVVIYVGSTWHGYLAYNGMTKVIGGSKYIFSAGAWVVDTSGGGASFLYASQVWVDSGGNDGTGAAGDETRPFLTIDAALDATTGPTVVHIGVGVFASPTGDLNYAAVTVPYAGTKMRANLWFKGTKKPQLDSYTAPTKLENGTVLVDALTINGISTRSGIKVSDLGIDCGTSRGAGNHDGLAVFNIGQVVGQAPLRDIEVENVIALCHAATSAVHSFAFENCIDPRVANVEAYYGIHGVAWKCIGGTLDGLISYGHQGDLLIIKEGNTGNASAPSNRSVITNIVGGALTAGDTQLGISFEVAGPSDLYGVIVSNVEIVNAMSIADLGFTIGGSATGKLRNITLDNIQTSNSFPSVSISGTIAKQSIRINGRILDAETTLTVTSGHVATDANLGNDFRVVLNANAVLDNPTNMLGGQKFQWRVKQDGTGSRLLTYGSKFKFAGGVAPAATTTANAIDLLSATYSATDDTLIAAFLGNAS